MLSKTFLCGLSLFLVVHFQHAASKFEIDSSLPLRPSTTLADLRLPIDQFREYSFYGRLTEFQFSLHQITAASYRHGCSNELNDYLFAQIDQVQGFSPPSPILRSELYSLLNHMVLQSFPDPPLGSSPFTVFAPAPDRPLFHAFYTPHAKALFEPLVTHCGCRIATFNPLPEIEFPETITYSLCPPWKYRRSAAALLPDPTPTLEPDLNLEFLNILNNPDDRVF